MSETPTEQNQAPDAEARFTQADLDRIVTERLERDRKARDLTPDEVKALKQQAADAVKQAESDKSEAQKASERMAELEARLAQTTLDALRARVQARFGISDDDATLFLTGADDKTLTAQAERLAQRSGDASDTNSARPQWLAREGSNPKPVADERLAFIRQLTGRTP